MSGLCVHRARWPLVHARVGLVHHLHAALLQDDEAQLVAVGDFDGLDKAEMLPSKRQNRLDLLDEQYRGKFFHGHRILLAVTTSLD